MARRLSVFETYTLPSLNRQSDKGFEWLIFFDRERSEPFKDQMLVLKGISNKVRGDGDSHMRGMSCLVTGKELFPGNIQGGSDTPAGWAATVPSISNARARGGFVTCRPRSGRRSLI